MTQEISLSVAKGNAEGASVKEVKLFRHTARLTLRVFYGVVLAVLCAASIVPRVHRWWVSVDTSPSRAAVQSRMAVPACSDATDAMQGCWWKRREQLKVGIGNKTLCVYPLPKEGNYTMTLDDGSTASTYDRKQHSASILLTAPDDKMRHISYMLRPHPEDCPATDS